MKKLLAFLLILIIGCSNSFKIVDSEWFQYKKLSLNIDEDFIGTQFDIDDLSLRLEIPAFYIANDRLNNYKIKIIAYNKDFVNYDNISSPDGSSNLDWNGLNYFESETVYNPTSVDKELEESLDVLKSRISSVSFQIKNLDNDGQTWAYDTVVSKPMYAENGLEFLVKNDYLINDIFMSKSLESVELILVLDVDEKTYTVGLNPLSQKIMNSFKSFINDQNLKYSRNAKLHSLD
jgi:hypothetical protein